MKKTYFHISRDINNIISEFYPKVPKSTSIHEDKYIKRVCIAKTLENCLSSINYIRDTDVFNEELNEYKPIRVYEFLLDEKNVLDPKEVSKYVLDAEVMQECWSTVPIKPVKSFIIKPTYIGRGVGTVVIDLLDFDIIEEE